MKRYALNSAVITAPGIYEYRIIDRDCARSWWAEGPVISTIGYAETAEALGELLGATVDVDRQTITMRPKDEALVFRLTARFDPKDKGALGRAVLAGHFELGLLRRTS